MKKFTIDIDKESITYDILAEISKQKGTDIEGLVYEYVQAGIRKDFNFKKLKETLKKEKR